MGISPASEMFQGRIDVLLQGMLPKLPKVHMSDILASLKHSFDENTKFLDEMLTTSHQTGFQVNLDKSYSYKKVSISKLLGIIKRLQAFSI